MITYEVTLPELDIIIRVLQIILGLVIIPRLIDLISSFIPYVGGGS